MASLKWPSELLPVLGRHLGFRVMTSYLDSTTPTHLQYYIGCVSSLNSVAASRTEIKAFYTDLEGIIVKSSPIFRGAPNYSTPVKLGV